MSKDKYNSDSDSFDVSEFTKQVNAEIDAARAGVEISESDEVPIRKKDLELKVRERNDIKIEVEPEGKPEANVDDEVENESRAIGNIYVYSKKCLNCIHFAPTVGKKVYHDCHFTNGNENCPASEVKVIVMLPYQMIAKKLYDAHVGNDAAKLSSLMARLNRQDTEEVAKVLSHYSSLLAGASTSAV